MKKILSVICLLSAISFVAQAGHSENTRSKCRWYAKRYATNGHISSIKCGIKYSYAHDRGCTWAEVHFTRSWCCALSAEVYSRSDGGGQYGFFHGACSMRGGMFSDLYLSLADADDPVDTAPFTPGNQDVSNTPIFEPGKITLSDISINLQSDPKDPQPNSYTLAVWVPNDDTTKGVEDTVYDSKKAIIEGTVSINKGILEIKGGLFTAKDFVVSREKELLTVKYTGGSKGIAIPKGISVDDVAVISFGDIKADETKLFKLVANTNDGIVSGNISITTYPNPAGNTLNIALNAPEETNLSFLIYDLNGKLMMQQTDNLIAAGDYKVALNIEALPAGVYFLLTEGAGVKVVKQITKE